MIRTFAHRMNAVKKIMAGVAGQAEALAKWGIDTEYLSGMQQQFQLVNEIEDKRNALKARSQEETVHMEQAMNQLEQMTAYVKKVVRVKLPHETWPEFGFRKGEYGGKTQAAQEDQEQELAG